MKFYIKNTSSMFDWSPNFSDQFWAEHVIEITDTGRAVHSLKWGNLEFATLFTLNKARELIQQLNIKDFTLVPEEDVEVSRIMEA